MLLCCTLALASAMSQEPDPPEKLLLIEQGSLPIILTAPHGGRKIIAGISDRKGDGSSKFTTTRDENTDLLAQRIAKALAMKLGGKPYLLVALFDRKQIDANRPANGAYEAREAKPFYDAYHKTLQRFRKQVQADWGRGIILDIHGQGAEPNTIYRGTNDGKAVTHLTDRMGRGALVGPKSVFGVMAKKGYIVFPPVDSFEKENVKFNGGYTVQAYGSKDGGAIDAIQLEIGSKLRSSKALNQTAEAMAEAISIFAREYLPEEKISKRPE